MSGLSKVERQRAVIKRLRARIEAWDGWAATLLGIEVGSALGRDMRTRIETVWEATRTALDEDDRLAGVRLADRVASKTPVLTFDPATGYSVGPAEGDEEDPPSVCPAEADVAAPLAGIAPDGKLMVHKDSLGIASDFLPLPMDDEAVRVRKAMKESSEADE